MPQTHPARRNSSRITLRSVLSKSSCERTQRPIYLTLVIPAPSLVHLCSEAFQDIIIESNRNSSFPRRRRMIGTQSYLLPNPIRTHERATLK